MIPKQGTVRVKRARLLMPWPPKRLAKSTPAGWGLRRTRRARRAAEAARGARKGIFQRLLDGDSY